ncbi:MAG: beta-ketoacyl synthase N-terminal-like domain-containing protein, partial [bacterium]
KYIDSLSLMAGIAAAQSLGTEPWPEEIRRDFGVVLGTAFGAMNSMVDFDTQSVLHGPNTVNPMDFPNTVANAAGSRIGIWLQLKGPNVTLTNGGTSFIDAVGFAWEGANNGLFKYCLAGAAEHMPSFLETVLPPSASHPAYQKGAGLLLASLEGTEDVLFKVTDYFAVQLKPDGSLPTPFRDRWEGFWTDVNWVGGLPEKIFSDLALPGKIKNSFSGGAWELGLGGWNALNGFLASSQRAGVLAAYCGFEGKLSLLKVIK